jgi:RNA polymerase sigma factor (sigma-70 family)
MKPQPLGTGRAPAFGRADKGHQALFEAACPGPVDRPHRARIKGRFNICFRMNNDSVGGHFRVSENGYWSRWDRARRCIADNRWHGKVRCEPDITDEQAAGLEVENRLCRWLDSECPAVFFKIPVLGYFLLWVLAGGLSRPRRPQRKNIHEYRAGLAPFHHVDRPDESEEKRLAVLYRGGDVIAGNTIIAAHIWIARAVARKYQHEAEFDDLIQEGTFGLYKALRKFDPKSRHRFSTLAYGAVEWAIKDYLKRLRRLQRHQSSDEISASGDESVLGIYARNSVSPADADEHKLIRRLFEKSVHRFV